MTGVEVPDDPRVTGSRASTLSRSTVRILSPQTGTELSKGLGRKEEGTTWFRGSSGKESFYSSRKAGQNPEKLQGRGIHRGLPVVVVIRKTHRDLLLSS